MGILKAVFMLTTGGDPDAIFNYWVHFWENMQLNIGIMAACASFLKPLVGRLLKLNSTAGGYSSYPSSGGRYYNRSGRTPMGGGTGGGNIGSRYANGNKRRAADQSDVEDEFELHVQGRQQQGWAEEGHPQRQEPKQQPEQVVESVQAALRDYASTSGGAASSDSNSEEIILQKQQGIILTRDVTIRYDRKQPPS
jgi:hypothetical protein